MPKYTFTTDLVHRALIQEGLNQKRIKFGKRYCPCKIENIDENVCPCLEYRNTSECHCLLFTE